MSNTIRTFAGSLALAILCNAGATALAQEAKSDWPLAEYGIEKTTNPAVVPEKHQYWNYQEARMAKVMESPATVIFLGDSITQGWQNFHNIIGGEEIWDKVYKPMNAANMGVNGDKTQNVLWRLTEGKCLDNDNAKNAKVVVLLIGINNLINNFTPAQTVQGTQAILKVLEKKLPNTKILMLGAFPCWPPANSPTRIMIKEYNKAISKFADNKRVFFLDFGDKFLEPDGSILKGNTMRDSIHLTPKGYQIWADAMNPYLLDILNNDGKGELWTAVADKK